MRQQPAWLDLRRRAADDMDEPLNSAGPAHIPVAEPSRFQFIINPKTARALGRTTPQPLLALAAEVIQ